MQRSRHIGAVVILGVGLLWSASLGAQIQQVTLANGQTYEVPTKDGLPIRFESSQVKFNDLGFNARIDPGVQEPTLQFLVGAELKAKGRFMVTVTTPLDPAVKTTFEGLGPGTLVVPFFPRTDYPTVWAPLDQPGSHWFPFEFSFEDATTGLQFRAIQWAKFDSESIARGVDAARSALIAPAVRRKDGRLDAPNPTRGSLGITMRFTHITQLIGTIPAAEIHFAKVDDGGDPFRARIVVPSNLLSKDQVFLLNTEPGRYAAVAAVFVSRGAAQVPVSVFLSREIIEKTTVPVLPGQMTYLGDVKVRTSRNMDEPDPAQAHYWQLLTFLPGVLMGKGTLDSVTKDAASEKAFWTKAVKDAFKRDPAWLDQVNARVSQAK